MSGAGGRGTNGISLINDISKIVSIFFVVIAILVFALIVFAIVKFAKHSKKVNELNDAAFKLAENKINEEKKQSQNWTCSYCGANNKKDAVKCSACGAKKSKSVKDA